MAGRVFTITVNAMGATVSLAAFVLWQAADPGHYMFLLALALLASGWRVGQMSYPGTASIGFVFIAISLAEFSLAETLFLGCGTVLVQSWAEHGHRMLNDTLMFRLSNLAVSIAAADYVYRVGTVSHDGYSLGPLVAAMLVFTLLHTFAAAVAQALSDGRRLVELWHECAYWTLPYYLLGGAVAMGVTTLSWSLGWRFAMGVLPVIYFLYRGAFHYLEHARARRAGSEVLASHQHRSLETLGLAISARFRSASDELSRTQTFCLWIAEDLRLNSEEVEALRIAAVLHDVGTLAVPEQIICKAGKLTAEEFEKVKVHPVVGASIIDRAEFPYPVSAIVRHHHERWDGGGYPDGIRGDQIPLGARILSAVDCLVALTTERPYRPAISLDRALAFIASQSGQAFAPKIAELVVRRAHDFERYYSSIKPAASSPDTAPGAKKDDEFLAPISEARRESHEVYVLAQELGQSLSFSDTLSTFCRRLNRVIPFDACAVYMLHGEILKPKYAAGSYTSEIYSLEVPLGRGPSGIAAKKTEAVLNADPAPEFGSRLKLDLKSALALPLEGADGTFGVLTLFRRDPAAFAENDLRILLGVRGILSAAVENSLRFQQAEASATTDHLTGLPNARSLFQRLEMEAARCRRSGGHFTALVCDLDGFKFVNDKFGHLMGNKVLQAVAGALQRNCREYDYVARMGGDEFVVLLAGLPASAVETRIRHLSLLVAETAQDTCPGCGVTLSAGQARYPDEGKNPESLLAAADAKMYAAKQRRKVTSDSVGYDFDWVGEPG